MPTLQHVMMIVDGNRRWARLHNVPPSEVHKAAFDKVFRGVIKEAFKHNVPYVTIWMASETNLVKRSSAEVYWGTEYIAQGLANPELLNICIKYQARIKFVGPRQLFKHPTLLARMKYLELQTKKYTHCRLTLLLPYDGKTEMLQAIRTLQSSKKPVTEKNLRAALSTGDLPDVDLMIRTGDGDEHLSTGSLMWLMANAQLYFPNILWPDFGGKGLARALRIYSHRNRRLGA